MYVYIYIYIYIHICVLSCQGDPPARPGTATSGRARCWSAQTILYSNIHFNIHITYYMLYKSARYVVSYYIISYYVMIFYYYRSCPRGGGTPAGPSCPRRCSSGPRGEREKQTKKQHVNECIAIIIIISCVTYYCYYYKGGGSGERGGV